MADRVRLGVADSLTALCDRLAEHIRLDLDDVRRTVGDIRAAERVRPEIYARYHQMIDVIERGDLDRVAPLVEALVKARVPAHPIECSQLDATAIGDDLARTYIANIDDETDIPLDLLPATPAEFRATAAAVDRGLEIFADIVPDCATETRELVSELLITGHDPHGVYFGAASSFNQWGAVVFDMSNVTEIMRFIPTLVHESAHILLFGLAMDEPLLTAEPGRRFRSPLREEPRTMDGVYHATIVCARMHYALGQMLKSGRLTDEECGHARKAMTFQHEGFESGARTISENADLSLVAGRMLSEAGVYLAGYDRAA